MLVGLVQIEWNRSNYLEGLRLAREARRIAIGAGNVWAECTAIRWQHACHKGLGDLTRTAQLLGDWKRLVVAAGMQGGQIDTMLMNSEADLHQLKTEYAAARHIHEGILRQTSPHLPPVRHAYALVNIAFLDIVTGAGANIVSRNLDTATAAFRNAQYPRGISACDLYRAHLMLREGYTIQARSEYIRLIAVHLSKDVEIAHECLEKLADPIHTVHTEVETERWAAVFLAFTLRGSARNVPMMHQALRCFGDVLARQGADNDALSILFVALEGFTLMDVHQRRAECMRTIGDVHFRRGDLSSAGEMWAARPLFERSEQMSSVAEIDARLQTVGVAEKLKAISKVPTSQVQCQKSGADSEGQSLY